MSEETTEDGTADSLSTIAGGAGLIVGGRITKLLFGFLSQLVMARLLGVDAYGSVVLVNITVGIVVLFVVLGLPGGLQRKIPYYEDDPEKARGVVKASGQIVVVMSGIVAGSLFLAAPWISAAVFDDSDLTLLLRIAALGLPFTALKSLSVAAAKASRSAVPEVIVNHILRPVTGLVFISALIVAGYEAPGAVAGKVIATVVVTGAALYLARRTLRFSVRGPTTRMHTEVLQFGLPLMLSAGMNILVFQTDTVLIGMFLESAAAGVYNVAFQFRSMGMFFFFSFAYLLPPVLARLEKGGKHRDALRTYQITSKWMVITTFPIVLGFVLFPEIIIGRIFGSGYVGGATPLRVLMLPVLVTALLGANGRALVALGHNKVNMYVNTGIGLGNLLLNLTLIPRYGIVGAAAATATALVTRDVAFALFLYRREGIFAITRTTVKTVVVSSLLAAVGYLLFVQFVTVSFLSALAWGIAFLAVYAPALVVIGGVESEDEEMVSLFEQRVGVDLTAVRSVVAKLQ
ncbi:flippase [Haloplanus pelagicus]|uniref:flippase n=1 Tax=Haloplanus pelagicus TaxID=2949995 RepID=UPI00203E0BF8|nr:flippase [Haloplanus sp. HW8-1]